MCGTSQIELYKLLIKDVWDKYRTDRDSPEFIAREIELATKIAYVSAHAFYFHKDVESEGTE